MVGLRRCLNQRRACGGLHWLIKCRADIGEIAPELRFTKFKPYGKFSHIFAEKWRQMDIPCFGVVKTAQEALVRPPRFDQAPPQANHRLNNPAPFSKITVFRSSSPNRFGLRVQVMSGKVISSWKEWVK